MAYTYRKKELRYAELTSEQDTNINYALRGLRYYQNYLDMFRRCMEDAEKLRKLMSAPCRLPKHRRR
jgi:hypothetical protein